MLKLGNIQLDEPFFQASLSGYSDYAMRKLANIFGVKLTFAGVMLAKSAANPRVLRKKIFHPFEDEKMVGAQILGDEPKVMAKAAKGLEEIGYKIIDLNFACPAPKVVQRKRGGFLLNQPAKVIEIYKVVREAVRCPVLMKLRYGFDKSEESKENFLQICEEAVKENVDALIVHGRTVKQKYTGKADWGILSELKQKFPNTTIIGSGDLFEAEKIAELMKKSKVDGVVIARGSIGNPWLFEELRAVLGKKDKQSPPRVEQQRKVIVEHFKIVRELYDDIKAVRYFRKFAINYCRRHPQQKDVQKDLMAAKDSQQLIEAISQWYN